MDFWIFFFYRGIHPTRGDAALEHVQKYRRANRAGGYLVARHQGSRSSQANRIQDSWQGIRKKRSRP